MSVKSTAIAERLRRFKNRFLKPRYAIALVVAGLVAWMIVRRQSLTEEVVAEAVDMTYEATMATHDANIVHTDSGIPRYHATAPVYYSFDNAPDPFWRFDKGAFIEQLDDEGNVVATLRCDSAVYDQKRQLWNCIGNVRVKSTEGDRFLTNQMFYDVMAQKIYSDSFIHIEKSDRIIEGYGFKSNAQITEYTLNNPTMILPVSDFNRPDSPADTTSAPTADSKSAGAENMKTEKTQQQAKPVEIRNDNGDNRNSRPARAVKTGLIEATPAPQKR